MRRQRSEFIRPEDIDSYVKMGFTYFQDTGTGRAHIRDGKAGPAIAATAYVEVPHEII